MPRIRRFVIKAYLCPAKGKHLCGPDFISVISMRYLSGSGKTVTTKIILRYLSVLSLRGFSGPHRQEDAPTVEMQVLQSNPILESFGNARTEGMITRRGLGSFSSSFSRHELDLVSGGRSWARTLISTCWRKFGWSRLALANVISTSSTKYFPPECQRRINDVTS